MSPPAHSQPISFTNDGAKIGIQGVVDWHGDMIIQQSHDPLSKLPNAIDAPIYSSANQHEPLCLNDTRVDLLNEIDDWANRQDEQCICWLSGLAGTGKSTIARTVARKYYKEKKRLAASFFFSRGGGEDVRCARKFVTSLAMQLAYNVEASKQLVREAINERDDITNHSLLEQWHHLILGPLSKLSDSSCLESLVIVVDALDECEDENDIRIIVRLLAEARSLIKVRLRILLTSRPERPIRSEVSYLEKKHQVVPHQIALHKMQQLVVSQDIDLFLRHNFERYRQEEEIEEDWPDPEAIGSLVQKASGLFIWAATAYRFICGGMDVDERLRILLEGEMHERSPEAHLNSIYITVLQASVQGDYSAQERQKYYKDLRTLLGSVVTLFSPLSVEALSKVLRFQKKYADSMLKGLHTILAIPKDNSQLLRLHHPSFRDFLLSGDRCSDANFLVEEKAAHRHLASECLRLMSNSLQQGACGIDAVGTLVTENEGMQFKPSLSSELQYACHYWIHHLEKGGTELLDSDEVHGFLQEHCLHWLEALGWMGKVSEGIIAISSLELMTRASQCREIREFVHDLKRFALYSRSVIEQAPLQVYCSALVFAPSGSIVKKRFLNKIPGWIKKLPEVDSRWSALLQTLEGHTKCVNAVAFSPDSKVLASASSDIKLWDVGTGALFHTLVNHLHTTDKILFSPNGRILASASCDQLVKLWDVNTGELLQTLSVGGVTDIALSPNSKMLALITRKGVFEDRVQIELWNLSKWEKEQTIKCSSDEALVVTFSPEGTALALVHRSKTASVLNVHTGKVIRTFESVSKHTAVLAPDGKIVASQSLDGPVKLWDATTGAILQMLQDVGGEITGLIFSPDGKVLVSNSYDTYDTYNITTRVWEVGTGQLVQTCMGCDYEWMNVPVVSLDTKSLGFISSKTVRLWKTETAMPHSLRGHSSDVKALAFSPNGEVLASASADGTVKLWDADIKSVVKTAKDDLGKVQSMVFSSDGKALASMNTTIKLWGVSSGSGRQIFKTSPGSAVLKCAFSPDGKLLAWTSQERGECYKIELWKVGTNEMLPTLKGHSDEIAFSPDSRWLASTSLDGKVKLWDLTTGEVLRLEGHSGVAIAIAFSPDATLLAAASGHRMVLWDIGEGKIRHTLVGNVAQTAAVAFSPDGGMIASVSCNYGVLLWDVNTGDSLQSLSCFPWDDRLEALQRHGTLKMWDVNSWGEDCDTPPPVDATFSTLLFDDGSHFLPTRSGTFLRTHSGPTSTTFCFSKSSPQLTSPPEVYISNEWIQYRGFRVLWLPPEYRATCVEVYSDVVAIGHNLGLVSLLEISDKP